MLLQLKPSVGRLEGIWSPFRLRRVRAAFSHAFNPYPDAPQRTVAVSWMMSQDMAGREMALSARTALRATSLHKPCSLQSRIERF